MQAHRTTASEFSSLPTPATSEPGFTVHPVDKDGNPTDNPNERWYHPKTGRLLQKGITQVLNEGLLRTPSVTDSTGGAISEKQARAKNRMVKVADQAAELAHDNGLKVSESIALSLMPTPNTMDHLPARTPEQKLANKGKGGYSNVRETVVNDLLPTTRAQHGEDRNNTIYTRDPKQPQNLENALAVTLMPTPTTRDHKDGTEPHERDGIVQTDTVARAVFNSGEIKLPTPTASDWKGANHSESGSASSRSISTVVQQTNWGKFEPAIRRWEEVLGRPAPLPTKPDGKDGAHRLSSAFTEWMMGLPAGWITDVGLSRNDELKACGNGVVPQQAALALQILLDGAFLQGSSIPVLPTVMANSPMRNSRRSMVTHPTKRSSVALNQALEIVAGQLPAEFETWDEVPDGYREFGGEIVNLPTPTVSDTFTDNLKSSQQKAGSMHSVTLPQAVKWVVE